MKLIIILICRGHSGYLEWFLPSDCGHSGHTWWLWVCTARGKVHNHVPGTACLFLSCNLESAAAASENTMGRLSGWRLLCTSQFEGVKLGGLLCLFSNKGSGRSGPQEQSFGWSRSPSWTSVLLWGDLGFLIVLWGDTALLADLHKPLDSTPLFQSLAAALGLFLDLVGNTWCNTQERMRTAARTLLSQIACPQNPAHSSSRHQDSNSRARS